MSTRNFSSGRTGKIIYWIVNLWLALGMFSTGLVQLLKMKEDADMMTHLGYPVYVLTILGIWKLLAVIVILIPGFLLVKEWAYAGMFFVMSGAVFSHIAIGDPVSTLFAPLLLLALTVLSWYLRPDNRKLNVSVNRN